MGTTPTRTQPPTPTFPNSKFSFHPLISVRIAKFSFLPLISVRIAKFSLPPLICAALAKLLTREMLHITSPLRRRPRPDRNSMILEPTPPISPASPLSPSSPSSWRFSLNLSDFGEQKKVEKKKLEKEASLQEREDTEREEKEGRDGHQKGVQPDSLSERQNPQLGEYEDIESRLWSKRLDSGKGWSKEREGRRDGGSRDGERESVESHGDYFEMGDIGKNSSLFFWCPVCRKLASYSIQYDVSFVLIDSHGRNFISFLFITHFLGCFLPSLCYLVKGCVAIVRK